MITHVTLFLIALTGCDVKEGDTNTKKIALSADSLKYITLEESGIDSMSLPDTSQYVILPVSYARWCLGVAQQDTLDEKEILIIEYALRKSIKLYTYRNGDLRIDLTKYKRQYFSGITASGDREVCVRCLGGEILEYFKYPHVQYDWRKDNIQINDGGDGIFSLKVNLTTRTTYDFITNGSETL
jgi:hypothetical protein